MGVNCSFLSFSIYLNLLLREQLAPQQFVQVGDDLFTINGFKALSFLVDCGIPVSLHKCLIGDYGEFCGTVFDRQGDLRVRSARNWINLLHNFGPKLRRFIPKKYRWTYYIACLPEPIGINLNPGILGSIPVEKLLELYPVGAPDKRFYISSALPKQVLREYVESVFASIDKLLELAKQFKGQDILELLIWKPLIIDRSLFQAGSMPAPLAESANALLKIGTPVEVVERHISVLSSVFRSADREIPDQSFSYDYFHSRMEGRDSYRLSVYKQLREHLHPNTKRKQSMKTKSLPKAPIRSSKSAVATEISLVKRGLSSKTRVKAGYSIFFLN
jgi:hypothetical protein